MFGCVKGPTATWSECNLSSQSRPQKDESVPSSLTVFEIATIYLPAGIQIPGVLMEEKHPHPKLDKNIKGIVTHFKRTLIDV